MSHIPQDESPHFPFKLGPPEYVPSQVHYNVVSLSVNIRTQILANHENINTMRFRPHIEIKVLRLCGPVLWVTRNNDVTSSVEREAYPPSPVEVTDPVRSGASEVDEAEAIGHGR